MPPKRGFHRSKVNEDRNLPIPLVLFSSYIAAEKSDELIKVFCKELPDILKNINDSKKALSNKTKSVYKLKEAITLDLKKLELANIVLKELFQEEETCKLNKDKELEKLHSQISSCQNSIKILNSSLNQYLQSKQSLDSVAEEFKQYKDGLDLIHSYLTLHAMNEKFIEEEYESGYHFKYAAVEKCELQKLLIKHKYDEMVREKILEKLLIHHQILKNVIFTLSHKINNALQCQMQEQRNRLHIKRWSIDVCLKIGSYKENPSYTEDFFKLMNEVQEFIIFARQIVLKLQN